MYIECQTNSEESIVKVELWFDGDSTGIEDLLEPFTLLLDSRNYENGFHNFFVKAYDKQNNTGIIFNTLEATRTVHGAPMLGGLF